MSAKERFLKKLQDQNPRNREFDTKSQADIAEFCDRMSQLKEQMANWLTDTGIGIEEVTVQLVEFLIGGKTFRVQGIDLHYEKRMVKFTPVFLYGQGVTGGVEVTLCAGGQITHCIACLCARVTTSAGHTACMVGALIHAMRLTKRHFST